MEIPIGSRFNLDELNYTAIEFIESIPEGDIIYYYYQMRCETAGTAGNRHFGELSSIEYISPNFEGSLVELLIPAEDDEDTEILRKRYFASFSSNPFGGNKQDYIDKTNSLNGVGGTVVIPVWDGGGTVKLIIIDAEFGVPSTTLIEAVQNAIVSEEEWALICKIHDERVLAVGANKRGKKTSGYSFSGKLVCGVCEAPYWRKQKTSNEEYWVCSTKQTKGRKTRKRDSTMGKAGEINLEGCDNENISYNALMEIMATVSERLQANTDTIKADMVDWLTRLKKRLLEANGGATEAELQKELTRKDRLLDAYLDHLLTKEDYQKKAVALDDRIIELKQAINANRSNLEDLAEIDRVLEDIDAEVAKYVDENNQLKVDYILEHLAQVQVFPDKVIVIVPILGEGITVDKTQYVSGEKWRRKNHSAKNTGR